MNNSEEESYLGGDWAVVQPKGRVHDPEAQTEGCERGGDKHHTIIKIKRIQLQFRSQRCIKREMRGPMNIPAPTFRSWHEFDRNKLVYFPFFDFVGFTL